MKLSIKKYPLKPKNKYENKYENALSNKNRLTLLKILLETTLEVFEVKEKKKIKNESPFFISNNKNNDREEEISDSEILNIAYSNIKNLCSTQSEIISAFMLIDKLIFHNKELIKKENLLK